jgi:hypothetical protein
MTTTALIILIVVLAIIAVAALAFFAKRRTTSLRTRFGPEYDRAVREYGDRSRAEKALERRTERTEKYNIHSLTRDEQSRFGEEWRHTQARFVDDPPLAIREADHLVCEVMRVKGYPMADFDRRMEDLSVSHANVVRNYRAAHDIATAQEEGRANTEDLRQAMVYYRELFDDLLEAQPAGPVAPMRRR